MALPPDELCGRNVVLAALQSSRRLREILVDDRARPDEKLRRLQDMARAAGVDWRLVPRAELDRRSKGGVHNGVVGLADPLPRPSLKEVLDEADAQGREPFLLLLDEVQYEQNLGAILRTASAAGVTALVTPTRRGAQLGPVVQRVAMGGAETVPVVREGLNSALAAIGRRGIRILGAEADGTRPYWEADFRGPLAMVLGGEDHGLGQKIRERCDEVVRIPLPGGGPVDSLNVSVDAGLLIYERIRQSAG